MTLEHQIHRALWLTSIATQAVIAIVMVVKGLHKRLPYFFTYTAYIVLSSIAGYAMLPHPRVYFWGYWIQNLLSWALAFTAIYEIYASLLKEYSVLQKMGTYVFWVIGVLLVTIAVWTAFSQPGSDTSRVLQTFYTLERSVRIVECGLLLTLFIFASFFGLGWKNYLFGIALGFSIFLSMQLAAVAARAWFGARFDGLFSWLQQIAYAIGILIWAFYIVKRTREADLRLLAKTQLAEWNETLQELLHR